MSDLTVIKCVRCANEFRAGETAGPRGMDHMGIIAIVIGALGWRQTFAGWQCPDHRR
jgi:hypothetical protein